MLHPGGSERLASLRATVARIEAGSPPPGGRSLRPASAPVKARLGSGVCRLDEALGGGLARGALHEIVAEHRGDDGAANGFALALAVRCTGPGPLVWIVEDRTASEAGMPYRPGLAEHGLDPDRLVLVRARDTRAALWACEEALRLKAPAVLVELWSGKPYGLVASRRLLLSARSGRGVALVLHAGLPGRAETLSSAADTRFAVAACPSPRTASAGNRSAIPGQAAFSVRLVKQRLGAATAFDAAHSHSLVWNAAQRCFDDHPVPVGVLSPAADRQADAPRRPPLPPAAAVAGSGLLRFG